VNPSAIIDSATGIVVVALIFAVPIIAVIAAFAITLSVVNARHKERMKMIEQGIDAAPPRKQKGNYYGLMITGAIFFAFGLALFCRRTSPAGANDFMGGFLSDSSAWPCLPASPSSAWRARTSRPTTAAPTRRPRLCLRSPRPQT